MVITRLIRKFKTTRWIQGHLSLSSFRGWFNEYQEFLVKSKLSPHSGSVSPWGWCTPSTKKGHKVLYIGVFQIGVTGWGEIRNFNGWMEPEEWFLRLQHFSKLKKAFCEYWTSIKIKIKMTYLSKEYQVKTKMEQ